MLHVVSRKKPIMGIDTARAGFVSETEGLG